MLGFGLLLCYCNCRESGIYTITFIFFTKISLSFLAFLCVGQPSWYRHDCLTASSVQNLYIAKIESLSNSRRVLGNYHTKYIILYTYGFCIMRRVSLAYNLGHYVNKGLSLFSNSIVVYKVKYCTKCPNQKNNGPLLYQMVYIF